MDKICVTTLSFSVINQFFPQNITQEVCFKECTEIQVKIMTSPPTSDISKVANKSQSSPVQAGLLHTTAGI
jgi:hypothetical protein